MNGNIITNKDGRLQSCAGPAAVGAFKLKMLLSMLNFKRSTGMDLDRRVPAIKVAKRETGLKTNKIDVLVAAVEAKMQAMLSECTIVTDGEVQP